MTTTTYTGILRTRTRLWAALAVMLAVMLGLAVLAAVGPAHADDLDDQRRAAEQKKRDNEAELQQLSHDLEEIADDLAEALIELKKIEQQLPDAQTALKDAQDKYAKAKREVKALEDRLEAQENTEADLVDRIAEDEARSVEVRASVGALARQALKGDLSTSSLAIMLDAADPQEYVQQYGLVTTAMRSQTQLLGQLAQDDAANRNAKVRLEAVRDRIAELRAAAVVKQKEANERRKEAQAHETTVRGLIDEQKVKTAFIQARKADYEAREEQLKKDRASLESDIKDLIAKQKERDERNAAKDQKKKKPGPVGSGIFQNPSSYSPMYVTSKYGWRTHPVLGYPRLHAGIDLRAYCGVNILAGRKGEVVWARYRAGYGNQVLVDHGEINGNSVMSSYNHLQGFNVSAGQSVSGGKVVGFSGSTGTSTACHLHFEVYVNGNTVDPYPYL